jgi:hypothetical protein
MAGIWVLVQDSREHKVLALMLLEPGPFSLGGLTGLAILGRGRNRNEKISKSGEVRLSWR